MAASSPDFPGLGFSRIIRHGRYGRCIIHPKRPSVKIKQKPNGGSTTTSLRQFRKKDVEKSAPSINQQAAEQQQQRGKPMTESHVARVAPHNHYPAAPQAASAPGSNDGGVYHRYPSETAHQFTGYGPQVKYSELTEPSSQPNPISTSVIQKPKPKDYPNMEMCNVQPQHLANHQQYSPDNGQYMHKDPSQGYPSGYHKPPESHYFPKEQPQQQQQQQHQHQFQHQLQPGHHTGMPKYNPMLTPGNMRKYNASENPYLNKLGKIHQSMGGRQMSLNDHPHLQDGGQPAGNFAMEQRAGMYGGQQQHRYYPGSIPQPNPYSGNPNYPMNNNAHPAFTNYPAGSCNYPRSAQMSMGPRYPYNLDRSMSPTRRAYAESVHVPHQINYHPMHHQKMAASTHNYSPQYGARGPEYAQHYQHRRVPTDVYPQTCRPAQYMQSHPAPDLQELTESTVSPSESLKTFIETFAVDEEPPGELGAVVVEPGPINIREKLRDDTPAGTVYMINASDVQYFENTGIPIVNSDSGGFQLTSENYQYLLKNGLISIDSCANQERVVNLQILEAPQGPKSDCMLADKLIRPPEAGPTNPKPPEDENGRRVMIHQQAILNPSGNLVIEKPLQKKKDKAAPTSVDNLTKELVDKNCSPINLDQLEDNLSLIEPANTQTDARSSSVNDPLLSEDQNSPGSKSMPIIDFYAESGLAADEDSCDGPKLSRRNSLTTVLDSLEVDKERETPRELKTGAERSTGTPTVIVTPESSRTEQQQPSGDGEHCEIEEGTGEKVAGSARKRKRIFSVDDIMGIKMKKSDVDVTKATTEFLERERDYACEFTVRTKSDKEETIRVRKSSVVLELADELLRISVSVVNGKTVINVKPISDSMIVVDYNQNYQKSSEPAQEVKNQETEVTEDPQETPQDDDKGAEESLKADESEPTSLSHECNKETRLEAVENLMPENSLDATKTTLTPPGNGTGGVSAAEDAAAAPLLDDSPALNGPFASDAPADRKVNGNRIGPQTEAVDINKNTVEAPDVEEHVASAPETVISCTVRHEDDETPNDGLSVELSQGAKEDESRKSTQETSESFTEEDIAPDYVESTETSTVEEGKSTLESPGSNGIRSVDGQLKQENVIVQSSDITEMPKTELHIEIEQLALPEVPLRRIEVEPESECAETVLLTGSHEIVAEISEETVDDTETRSADLIGEEVGSLMAEAGETLHPEKLEGSDVKTPQTETEGASSIDDLEQILSDEANNSRPAANYAEGEDFLLEDEVFMEEPPARELVVADPLEGIGVIDGPDMFPRSPGIPLEAVSTSDITPNTEKVKREINREIQILSPTSTNVDDHPRSPMKTGKRKYSSDNDVSESSPSSTVVTKAAKKMYESDLRVQHDIVSSSKKEAPKGRKSNVKRSKRLTEKGQVKSEQKELLKLLSEKRKRQKERELLKQSDKKEEVSLAPGGSDKADDHDEEFVDFRELLKARKLKKLKRMQELAAPSSSSSSSSKADLPEKPVSRETKKERTKSCCIGCDSGSSSKPSSGEVKHNNKVELKEEKSVKVNPGTVAPPKKLFDKQRLHRRMSSYEDMPSSTSHAASKDFMTTEVIHSPYLKDPRRRSKSFTGQIMVPSVSELIEENGGSSSKKKISLADYVSRKRRETLEDKRLKLHSRSYDSSDVKRSFAIQSSDWEDSNSPPPPPPPPPSKKVRLPDDLSGLIRTTKKPVIDLNELLPSPDKKLQEYKEKVDSQLSSLNIRIPKIKPPPGSPKGGSLVQRFLKDEKLTPEEMCKIRKIVSYKRSMQQQQHSKNVQSPSEGATRMSEEEARVASMRNLNEDSSSVTVAADRSADGKSGDGYSVFNRLGEDGLPKIVFKRKLCTLRQPVVELVKLDLGDLDRLKAKYNVTVRQSM